MANRIKGITIELDGDTTGLENALKDVNKESRKLQTELKQVEKSLKMDPGNTELIAQKQELLQKAVAETTKKLDALKTAQSQVEEQFKSGKIDEQQYRAFQRELVDTETALKRFEGQLKGIASEQDRFGDAQKRLQTYLQATNQDIDDLASTLGTRLTNAIRDGSATSDQLESALQKISRKSGVATQDIAKFDAVLRQTGNGANLDKVRQDLEKLSASANEAEQEVKGLGDNLGALAGGAAAGIGVGAAVTGALNNANLEARIQVSMDVPEEALTAIKTAINDVTKYGIDGEEALEAVRRQWALNADATDEANAKMVESAAVIASAYQGIDMIELVQEANEIGGALGVSNEQALGMVNSLLKIGFPPEQLDIIAEYGEQLKIAGYDAEQVQNILSAAVDTKSWNIDNLLDGLKESKIGLSEFGLEIPKALDELLDKTSISSEQMQNWGKAVAAGGTEGSQAMLDVAKALADIDDAALRNEIGVKVFGTKFEDQGMKLVDTLINAEKGTADLSEGVQALTENVDTMNADPLTMIKDVFGDMMISLSPLLTQVSLFVGKIGEWAKENPTLIASIAAAASIIGVLVGGFAALMPAVGALISAWPVLAGGLAAITGPIGLTVAAIVGLIAVFTALWNTSDTFRAGVTNTFNAIKDVALRVFGVVKEFIVSKISEIKAFWESDGAQFLQAFRNIFIAIKAVIDFVMPYIKVVVGTVWGGIKTIISGVLDFIMGSIRIFSGIFTGDFSKMWQGIKQMFSGSVQMIIGLLSTGFFGAIRSIFSNLGGVAVGLVQGAWSSITSIFSNFSAAATNTVSNMIGNVLGFLRNLASNAAGALANLPSQFISIGRDMMQGLINGIKSLNPVSAVTDMVGGLVSKAKGLLKIKSPSRVFMQIGKYIGEGLSIGINASDRLVQKAITTLTRKATTNATAITKKVAEISKAAAQQEIKATKKGATPQTNKAVLKALQDYAKAQIEAGKMNEKAQVTYWQAAAKQFKKGSTQHTTALANYNKAVKAYDAKRFENTKAYIDKQKEAGKLSVKNEAALWQAALKTFKKGSAQYKSANQQYQAALKAVNDQIVETNKEYREKMFTINSQLNADIKAKNKEYKDALAARIKDIVNVKKLTENFNKGGTVSKDKLTRNLQNQVTGLSEWAKTMEKLRKRIKDKNLLAELETMDVSDLQNLNAINSMSDKELKAYEKLYGQKYAIAKTAATKQLATMKQDTEKQIATLKTTAKNELAKVEAQWAKSIKNINKTTATNFKSLNQIGKNAASGLLNGLKSMNGALAKQAKEMANAISKTIKKALDIHSPSRVMDGFGVNIGQGLINGIESTIKRVAQTASRLSGAVISAQDTQVAQTAQRMQSVSNNINNSKTMAPVTNIYTTESPERVIAREYRKMAMQF